MLERTGFEIAQICTPGELDWDIVEGMVRKEGFDAGRFWNTFAKEAGDESKMRLQDWIKRSALSSHMRVVARKR